MERLYPNQFARIGVDDSTVEKRIQACFETIFFDPEEKFYQEKDGDSGCMIDTGNADARTEGMSYGMMMCVQMNRQDLFDRLWQFSMRYMYLKEGPMAGYFAWSVKPDGEHNAEGPAPDGEEYFAMALLLASARWGDREGIFDYGQQAREILRHCLHQPELAEGGRAMWDEENRLIRFVPQVDFSDPSYHLPHFYTLFARQANEEDRNFWQAAAEASRNSLGDRRYNFFFKRTIRFHKNKKRKVVVRSVYFIDYFVVKCVGRDNTCLSKPRVKQPLLKHGDKSAENVSCPKMKPFRSCLSCFAHFFDIESRH